MTIGISRLIDQSLQMEIALTEVIVNCWGKTTFICLLCQITVILTFTAVVVSPLTAIHRMIRTNESANIVTNLVTVLYSLFIVHGATLIEMSEISDNPRPRYVKEYILFYTGFFIIGIFFIAFVMSYIKNFLSWNTMWRVVLLAIGLISLTYFIVVCFVKFYEREEDHLAYYILLVWIFACSLYMGVIVVVSIIKNHIDSVPIFFYLVSTITLGLWNILIWTCITVEDKAYSSGLLLMTLALLIPFFFSNRMVRCPLPSAEERY
eukprot:TRINITY_DN876_c0_g1_i4.p1 TRINITY_DN876_c0_g1~~TRINITY_DN876_c0_g1_i4.p1  ORF type:complete len:264 (+),score=22.79 TRINITY_DN876_c0_g1_i4:122-913(+)